MRVIKPEFPDHGSPFSKEKERDRKIEAIKSAAAKRINRVGVRGARLEDIAADLGLTKTSISYYYASKVELAEAVYLAAVEFLEDAVEKSRAVEGPTSEKIISLFEAYIDQLTSVMNGHRPHPVHIQDLDTLPEEAQKRIVTRLSEAVGTVNEMLTRWLEETGSPLGRSEPATFSVFGLLDWLNISASNPDMIEFDAASGILLDVVRKGLAQDGQTALFSAPHFTPAGDLPQIFDRETRNRMKREAFLKAGTRYFNAYGFEGVSLAEVAASLGVTRGAFYYHIPDKENFLDQCLDSAMETVESVLDSADKDNGLAFIERVLFDLIYLQSSGITPLIRLGLMTALPAARQRRYQARLRNISRRLGDAHEEAIKAGQVRDHDSAIVETILTSMMFLNGGYTLAAANSFNDWRISEDPQSATNDYMYILLRGLTGPT